MKSPVAKSGPAGEFPPGTFGKLGRYPSVGLPLFPSAGSLFRDPSALWGRFFFGLATAAGLEPATLSFEG
jgi:hypothetical protein